MSAIVVPRLSVEEYLAIDRLAELKSEYHDGAMLPIAAVSWEHAIIAGNLAGLFHGALRGGPCRTAISPIRVRVSPTRFIYPDLAVVCDAPVFTDEKVDTITNPKVVVEVLSPSTADYDYGGKFHLYRRLSSFEEYILVSQNEPRVEVFRKTPDGRWVLTTYEGSSAEITVESLGISIPMVEIYAGATRPGAQSAP